LNGPGWLVDDLLRVEELLLVTAGSSRHPLVAEAASHVMKAGGKRLRPALVLLSSRAGKPGLRASDEAAAAVELIHLASLYHDDVIDQTDTRRGAPTVHSKWGIEVAVLAGDYLFAQGCLLGAASGGEIPTILSRALADVCEGQIAEDQVVGDPSRGVRDYMETIELKTAALFRAACEMGACSSGAGRRERGILASFGVGLGVVFQVIDDLLDLVGDEDLIGKPLGTDLKEGVFTLPVLIGCERDPSLRDALAHGERELEFVLGRLEECGAIEAAFEVAEREAGAARTAIASLGTDAEWTAVLDTIIAGVLAQAPSVSRAGRSI
jgi:heptaprenyl diphosphate synthase